MRVDQSEMVGDFLLDWKTKKMMFHIKIKKISDSKIGGTTPWVFLVIYQFILGLLRMRIWNTLT
jgi:hypothetical protein